MEIIKRNIFDDIIGKSGSIYESAILSCFSFDPIYFIQYYLPRLNSINVTNIVVLIDAGQYDVACEEFIKYKESVGRNVRLNFSPVRITPSFHGVFHSKIVLLIGPHQCTALIGSGNLTYGGMTYNNEVWNAFSANNAEAAEALIISFVWNYLSSLVKTVQKTIGEQFMWMTRYSDCLQSIIAKEYKNEGEYQFLTNESNNGIGHQLLRIIGDEIVNDITIVSPYYDSDGSALIFFLDNLHPRSFLCLGDYDTGTWPFAMPKDYLHLVEFRSIRGRNLESRTHAKIIQIHTRKATYLISGSANATEPGLGLSPFKNDEAVVLIRHEGFVNYINDMGIFAGDVVIPSQNEGSKKQSLSQTKNEVTILSCELWNGEYLLSINKQVSEAELLWIDVSGKEGVPVHFEEINKFEVIKFDKLPYAASLILARNGTPISNRIFILADTIIRDFCPDRAMKHLSRLIDFSKGQDWDSNLTQILSYVTFDEDLSPSSSKHITSRRSSLSKTPQDAIIDRKDFSASPLYDNAIRRNNRILDYFFKFISNEDTASQETEEAFSASDIDSGEAIGDEDSEANRTKNKPERKRILSEKIEYLNRSERFFDGICKSFDTSSQPILLEERTTGFQQVAKSKSYSSCLIAVFLLHQLVKDNESQQDKSEEVQIYQRMIRLLGRFFLIYRDFTIENDIYFSVKMQEMKKNLLAYSLLLISHFDWGYGSYNLNNLLVLNLLDMYKGDPERFKSAIDAFETSIVNSRISINPQTLEVIRRCVNSYSSDEIIISSINNISFPAIVYKKRLGFMYCSDAESSESPYNNALAFVLTVLSPGFKNFDPILLHNASKLSVFREGKMIED